MHVFLIAAQSVDGFIAPTATEKSTNWTSAEDKKHFVALTKRAGVVVMGRTSFDTIGRALPERRMIVYTRGTINLPGVETTTLPPRELIAQLAHEGHTEVAICGGAQIYDLFLSADVVDTLYLTIEPIVFGAGVKLFTKERIQRLTLKETTHTEGGTLFLEYHLPSKDSPWK